LENHKKHGPGNWEYRFKYIDSFKQKEREKSKRGFATKGEAEAAAAEVKKNFSKDTNKKMSHTGITATLISLHISSGLCYWMLNPICTKNSLI
jgi:hypothetical protein